jgi:hypothetical protein
MEYFRTKNPNFWYEILEGLGKKHFDLFQDLLVYVTDIWYILVAWCIFSHFGTLYHGRSGNPGRQCTKMGKGK